MVSKMSMRLHALILGLILPSHALAEDEDGGTGIGDVEILSEEGATFNRHGIVFKQPKIVTPRYECRAKKAVFKRNSEVPDDLTKAEILLSGGVIAKIGDSLGVSESAVIRFSDLSIEFHGFPHIRRRHSVVMGLERDAKVRLQLSDSGFRMITKGHTQTVANAETAPPKPVPKAVQNDKESITIEADKTSYDDGVARAVGNVRIDHQHQGERLKVSCGSAAFFQKGKDLIAWKRVSVELRGKQVFGSHALIDTRKMTATIHGPGHYMQDNRIETFGAEEEVRIAARGIVSGFPEEGDDSPLTIIRWSQENAVDRFKNLDRRPHKGDMPKGNDWKKWIEEREHLILPPSRPSVPPQMPSRPITPPN